MKLMLLITFSLALLLGGFCLKKSCLHGTHHKAAPSPEHGMLECQLYSDSSCCHANFTKQISSSPVIKVDNFYWNRCGNLSKACENYMKKIECFYQCSPSAAHWVHPNMSVAIQHVPVCRDFCDSWFEACRSDLVCAHNLITDWTIDESGNHCKNDCIPFEQMYVNGTDLCESAWGFSFRVSSCPCRCLDMTPTDKKVIKYILHDKHSEESGEEESELKKACKSRFKDLETEKAWSRKKTTNRHEKNLRGWGRK
ncbi:riboflavin-binding protein-like [Hyperolius riggenbachi]|uniref:riboflavin-binding protein-like n=1 Tax=Hyperolius riggenbachi TaxID=752182 RepID=UPI0035A2AD87